MFLSPVFCKDFSFTFTLGVRSPTAKLNRPFNELLSSPSISFLFSFRYKKIYLKEPRYDLDAPIRCTPTSFLQFCVVVPFDALWNLNQPLRSLPRESWFLRKNVPSSTLVLEDSWAS